MRKLEIDAEKFAYHVMNSHVSEKETPEEFAKEQLTYYLSSYFLVEDFNELENSQFEALKNMDYKQLFLSLKHMGN